MIRRSRSRVVRSGLLASAALLLAAFAGGAEGAGERYSAFLINPREGNISPTGTVQITIYGYSADADRARLLDVVGTKGIGPLYDFFRTLPPIGHMSGPGRFEIDMEYAETSALKDGGRRILLVGYRFVTLTEKSDHPDRARFPFTVIDLRLKAKGDGEGIVAMQAQVSVGRNGELRYEDFASPAIQLKRVRPEAVRSPGR